MLFVTACGSRGDDGGGEDGGTPVRPAAVDADFGDLGRICTSGTASGSSVQGVTDKEIRVGVVSDVGFTKNSEFLDAAKVFTSWCNDAGGINGRKLVAVTRDTKMLEVRQRMAESCRDDFALVGGGGALDAMGVRDRLECLLPEFPAQVVQLENQGSDLQVSVQAASPKHWAYEGFYTWLTKEAYPGSADAVGIIGGDSPVSKGHIARTSESLRIVGANPSYTELYPPTGVADWTPYAQSIKNKGVKGLIFHGDYNSLAKLEQILTSMQYKLDWIDANSSAYTPAFLEVTGDKALAFQNNVADLGGFHPLERADSSPAVKQILDLYAKYAPGANVTFPALKAFSSWLLFAKSAVACGDTLTRRCVYETAAKEAAWTGGGLQAPIDLTVRTGVPVTCFNVEQAGPEGWKPADFGATTGPYRCNAPATELRGDYGRPVTLADVGKSMDDFH
ncbi:ABC transporter substrate-binding protein [Yinghuangia sp. ASG 101]|nr:ABC transporter substrate-binding protein [Yinghuangia sp. ASG 101]UGQ11982.1 ABC transporter substrate-binding protein [Yinghuangia sp. ASG 101]